MTDKLAPPFDRAVMRGLFTDPLYDAASVRELFVAVGPPDNAAQKADAVAAHLSNISATFAFELWNEKQPRSEAEAAAALRLGLACETILTLTGAGIDAMPSPDSILPTFGPGGLFASASIRGEANGMAATMNQLRAVHLLRLDALKMAEIRAKRSAMKPAKEGRRESAAIKHLVAALAALYFEVWDRVPTVSRSKANATAGTLTGTFVLLLAEVARALIARGLPFYATAESLYAYWRALPADERMRLDMVKTTTPAP